MLSSRLIRSAFVASVLAAMACNDSDKVTGSDEIVDVYTVANAFSPYQATIHVGGTIRFNIISGIDGDGHDVTFNQKPGVPANINVINTTTVTQVTRVFNTRGT